MTEMKDALSIREYVDQTLETLRDNPSKKVDERMLLLLFLRELGSLNDRLASMEKILFGNDKEGADHG